jgi:hypothetical protein
MSDEQSAATRNQKAADASESATASETSSDATAHDSDRVEPLFDLSADERDALNARERAKLEKQQAALDDERGYYVGEWLGHRRYQCQSCPYDTLDEDTIITHVESTHGSPVAQAPARRATAFYDRYGNRLTVDAVE